jgi:predicted 2-oxoglutarate/Fe(II)-dependent dioxygenase YbiX
MLARKDLPRAPATPPAVLAIDRIQHVLARAGSPGTFATRHTAGTNDIFFDVVGVGAVPLPLSPRTAGKLRAVAKPARYGMREKTLLDPRVRDTWEIGKRQVKLDERHWQRTLDRKLPLIARDLAVPEGATLRAELHNLLVYEPGQFFAPHQDSEKADGMIGSLVVLLPSDAKGGALVIEHHDEKVSYRGSPNQLVLVAFYADCRHEVRPVTSGYRAALTFNLFLDAADHRSARPPSKPADALVELVREYFETPRPARGPHWPSKPAPERLVYLLDHEYTQKGLSWRALKNGDAVRAALLRDVAERLDCEVVLALADVHETWSCEDDWEYGYGRRRRGWYAHDDEDDVVEDDGDEDYTLIELCDSDVELRHWVSPSDKRVRAISDEVLNDEICFTKPSVDLEPFESEHEGYTGNAGNTVDRWYHRAAVLLWPRTRTFAIRAKASPACGIREIARALARGKADVARKRIGELIPFWNSVVPHEKAPGLADQVLLVADAVDDISLATALVDPIKIEQVTPKLASRWGDLLRRYGLTWCAQVFERWTSRDERYGDSKPRSTWLVSLPALAAPLCTRSDNDGGELVRRIARAQWTWLDSRLDGWIKPPLSSYSIKSIQEASRPIVGLLAAAAIAGDHDLQSTIVGRLTAERGYPAAGALAVLRAGTPLGAAMLGLGSLHEGWTRTLTALVATPPRAAGDWSIRTKLGCQCELCARLGQFLRAANQQQFEWPLAKDRRAHVHGTITSYELPVTHVTRRVGSPYTLVLTKTRALFACDANERATWARDLAWLRENAKTLTSHRRANPRRTATR